MTKRVTQDEIEQAKNVDLVSLCQANGIDLFQRDSERNQLRWTEHDSLVINTKKNIFKWYSKDNVGGDAINFVREVLNIASFSEAVRFLNGQDYKQAEVVVEEEKPFDYYFRNESDFSNANDYLLNRGISSEIIDCLHQKGFLQEVKRYDKPVEKYVPHLAFVWAKDGVVAGTTTQNLTYDYDRFGESGKDKPKIVGHSEKDFGFNITLGKPESIYVFEGAVDLLSYWTMNPNLTNSFLCSLEGVKEQSVHNFLNYVILSKRTIPSDVYLSVDNDVAGHRLNDAFRGLEYATPDGDTLKFHTNIPNDLVVPKDLMTLYQDSLTQLNSSMPIEYLAAIHKSITNFSEKHDIGNGMGYEKYFVCKEEKKKPEYSLEGAVKQVISDYDKQPTHGIEAVKEMIKTGGWLTLPEEKLFNKVVSYIDSYEKGNMQIEDNLKKDWNDVLTSKNQQSFDNKQHLFTNQRDERLKIIKDDTDSKKPFKGILERKDSAPVLFFEAENRKQAVTLAKNYGFYALDKEDSKKYKVNNPNKKAQSNQQATPTKMKRQFVQTL